MKGIADPTTASDAAEDTEMAVPLQVPETSARRRVSSVSSSGGLLMSRTTR